MSERQVNYMTGEDLPATYPTPTLQDEVAGRVSYVVHRTEPAPPEPASVQIKVGESASGKKTYECNVHAASVEEAVMMLVESERQLRASGLL